MKFKEISGFFTQEAIMVTHWGNALRSQGSRHSLAMAHSPYNKKTLHLHIYSVKILKTI